jgi:hypothetical protein
MLTSGRPKFRSLDEVDAELQLFSSDDAQNKEKVARTLGAIGQSLWKGDIEPTNAEYAWLRELACYFVDWCLCTGFRSIESNKHVLYDRQ